MSAHTFFRQPIAITRAHAMTGVIFFGCATGGLPFFLLSFFVPFVENRPTKIMFYSSFLRIYEDMRPMALMLVALHIQTESECDP